MEGFIVKKTLSKTNQQFDDAIAMPPALSRTLPFGIYMFFVALQEIAPLLGIELPRNFSEHMYPIKICLVGISLLLFWRQYHELYFMDLRNLKDTTLSISTGVLVFIIWINLDFSIFIQGEQTSFNPNLFESTFVRQAMLTTRIIGAVMIVPIMEEIFWRSFLARYLLKKDFLNAPMGQFTLFSFIVTAVLFGLEHQLFLAGIIAGAAYNLLLFRTKSIVHCILSHAVTNLALAIYVLSTGQWQLW